MRFINDMSLQQTVNYIKSGNEKREKFSWKAIQASSFEAKCGRATEEDR